MNRFLTSLIVLLSVVFVAAIGVTLNLGSVTHVAAAGDENEVLNPYHGNAEAIEEGSRLWLGRNCYGCHGTRAGGGMGPNLVDGRWRYGGDDASVFKSIYEGRPDGMPAWKDIMTEEEIWKVIAFLRSLANE